jgi:hypothetical protein
MIRTATGKEQALVDFYAQMARDASARPGIYAGSATELARLARVGRPHLARLFAGGSQGRQSGRFTWKHVLPLLSVEALCALKQCSAWNTHAEAELQSLARDAWQSAA